MGCFLVPWIATLEALPAKKFDSGCPAGPDGVVPCAPEVMRKNAERALGRPLSLEVYSVARNVASEAGTGSIAEKIGIAEAALNRARHDRVTLDRVLMRDGRYYAAQLGTNPAVSTRQDPSVVDIAVAELVLSGRTSNFIRGATHYFSPKGVSSRETLYDRWFGNWGDDKTGLMWVGPLPGVNPEEQFFMRPVSKSDWTWNSSYYSGRAALREGSPGDMLCQGSSRGAVIAVVGITALGGAVWYYFRNRRARR